jgi:DMSO reductase family type II enzyme heme b subunit
MMLTYPAMMMGEKAGQVTLYYWRADKEFQVLKAHGRSTTQANVEKLNGKAMREGDGWTVVMEIGPLPTRTPLIFAVWDGSKEHRDGLKYFSLWYEIE